MVPKGIEARERKDGQVFYRARIRRGGFNLRADFETIEEALAWQARGLRDIREGRVPSTPGRAVPDPVATVSQSHDVTLADACRTLCRGMKAGTIRNKKRRPYKQSVVQKYESMLRVHALDSEHGIGGMYLTEIEPADAREFVNGLANRKSPGTAHKVLTALKVVGHQAVADRLITVSPFASVSAPVDDDAKDTRVIELDEADRIRAAARRIDVGKKQSRAYPLVTLALTTGLRSGEVLALRYGKESLDLDRGVIVVGPLGNLSRTRGDDGRFPLIAPKTTASLREVEIPASTLQILREHRLATGRPSDGQFVFANAHGNPLCGSTQLYRDCWLAAVAEASIPDPRPRLHDARHHWAIFMLRAGVLPQALLRPGGWSSLKMLQDRYGRHALREESTGLGARLEAYLDEERASTAR